MENKNFEKKEERRKNDTDTGIIVNYINKGYNECLDRTNAKGIYEAGNEVIQRIAIDTLPFDVRVALRKLQTELKKAES